MLLNMKVFLKCLRKTNSHTRAIFFYIIHVIRPPLRNNSIVTYQVSKYVFKQI